MAEEWRKRNPTPDKTRCASFVKSLYKEEGHSKSKFIEPFPKIWNPRK